MHAVDELSMPVDSITLICHHRENTNKNEQIHKLIIPYNTGVRGQHRFGRMQDNSKNGGRI